MTSNAHLVISKLLIKFIYCFYLQCPQRMSYVASFTCMAGVTSSITPSVLLLILLQQICQTAKFESLGIFV